MLDFRELSQTGKELEQLARELLIVLGFRPRWSGVGPDGGKDLTFDEPGSLVLGSKPRRWLVSCKNYAHSGTAVGRGDIDGVADDCAQHDSQGFLLICTTHPSTGAQEKLDAIERNSASRLHTHVWDGVTLQRLLDTPRGWAVAQQFMPVSAARREWRIYATERPNRWVGIYEGMFVRLANRHDTEIDFSMSEISAVIDHLLTIPFTDGIHVRVRAISRRDPYLETFIWVDVMVPYGVEDEALSDVFHLQNIFEPPDSVGQYHFDVEVVNYYDEADDDFDLNHERYYRRLPMWL